MIAQRYIMPPNSQWRLVEAYQYAEVYFMKGVLDNIKNRLLDFILEPEEHNLLFADKYAEQNLEQIQNSFIFHIYGDHNVIASGRNIKLGIEKINNSDLQSLVAYFKKHNIPNEDIQDLIQVIRSNKNLDAPLSNEHIQKGLEK